MSINPTVILIFFVGILLLFSLTYVFLNIKPRHKHKPKPKHNENMSEFYINKTNKLMSDLDGNNQTLIGLAKSYALSRKTFEDEIIQNIKKAKDIYESVKSNQQSTSTIFANIMETSGIDSLQSDLSNAVKNAKQDVVVATQALNTIENLINSGTTPPPDSPLQLTEFGNALNDIDNQQNIANNAYKDIQTKLKDVTFVYNLFNSGLQEIKDNFLKAQEDLKKLNEIISNMTGDLQKTPEYNNLQVGINQANVLLRELKGLNIDNSNQYYSVMQKLIRSLSNSVEVSRAFLANILIIFTLATEDSPTKLNGYLNELKLMYNKISSLVGVRDITSDDSTDYNWIDFGETTTAPPNDWIDFGETTTISPWSSDVETTASPYMETTASPDVETTANPYMETTASPYMETTASPYMETTTGPYMETTTGPYMETTTGPWNLKESYTNLPNEDSVNMPHWFKAFKNSDYNMKEQPNQTEYNTNLSTPDWFKNFNIQTVQDQTPTPTAQDVNLDIPSWFKTFQGSGYNIYTESPIQSGQDATLNIPSWFKLFQGSVTQQPDSKDITINILAYYEKLLEINVSITQQYNEIINSFNIIVGVINAIQDITTEITTNIDSRINSFISSNEIEQLQEILLNYFPASTKPPLPVPPLHTLIDFKQEYIPTMTTAPPYTKKLLKESCGDVCIDQDDCNEVGWCINGKCVC